MKKKLMAGAGALVVIALTAVVVLTGGTEVDTVQVKTGDLIRTVEETAYVKALNDCQIQALQPGRILEVYVESGDEVEEGQQILLQENLDLSSELESVKAGLTEAGAKLQAGKVALNSAQLGLNQSQKDLERKEELLAAGAISQQDYDSAVLALSNLQRAVAEQEAYVESLVAQKNSLGKMHEDVFSKTEELLVKSPQKGTVLEIPMEKGQVLSPGTMIARIGEAGALEVEVDILSDDLAEIELGQNAIISAPVLGDKELPGKVKKIAPQAHEKTSALGVVQRRVKVIISLDDSTKLRPGYEVRVSIETRRKPDVLVLPRETVLSGKDGVYKVMAVVNGKVKQQQIQIGLKNQDFVEIIEGLQEGDIVIRDASMDLAEGKRVKI